MSACDDAGWFHTGDLGRFDREGRLVITGRKRDVIVTGHGKAISPQPIEDTVRPTSQMIAQVLVHGDRRRFLSALIALDQEALAEFAKEHGLAGDYELLARHPRVFEAIEHAVERANTKLSHHEQVRKFAILSQAPSAANGELTVTQSLRRSVAEKHRGLLDSFYQEQY